VFGDLRRECAVAQQSPRVELALRDGLLHRALRFAVVTTVGESATVSEFVDVGEHSVQRVFGRDQPNRADARCVDDRATAGDHMDLAGYGRVAAFGVALAHPAGGLHRFADEQVQEVRLARARLADQRGRRTERDTPPQLEYVAD